MSQKHISFDQEADWQSDELDYRVKEKSSAFVKQWYKTFRFHFLGSYFVGVSSLSKTSC